MSATTPRVSLRWVYDPAAPAPIALDTPAWTAWLEAPTTTCFTYPIDDPLQGYITAVLTVRKERRQRGGTYWVAYRRRHGHLQKVYLGRAATLTQARLAATARRLDTGAAPACSCSARPGPTPHRPSEKGETLLPGKE